MHQEIWILQIFTNSSQFLHRIWLFPQKTSNVGSILLCIVANIFITLWTTTVPKSYANALQIMILQIFSFFSSPEPKAQVSYCHSAPSIVRPSVVRRRPSVVRPSVNFHIFNFFSRTAWWILMKLGRDEVLMVPYKCCCFSYRSAQGWIQGGAKIGHGGPLLQESSSSDRKATATNRMHSNDLETCGKKCCYFSFHSDVKFLTRFWRLFGLSHFALF